MSHVVADHSAIDPTYVEDFLLTYKTFYDHASEICSKLLNWFLERPFRDKVRNFPLRTSVYREGVVELIHCNTPSPLIDKLLPRQRESFRPFGGR